MSCVGVQRFSRLRWCWPWRGPCRAPTPTGEQHQILAPDTITAQTPYGELVRLAPPVKFSETKPFWQDPVLVVRGSSRAQWRDS
jgi:hypothetical protein